MKNPKIHTSDGSLQPLAVSLTSIWTNPTNSALRAVFGKSPEIDQDLFFPQDRVQKEVILRLAIRRQNKPQAQGVVRGKHSTRWP